MQPIRYNGRKIAPGDAARLLAQLRHLEAQAKILGAIAEGDSATPSKHAQRVEALLSAAYAYVTARLEADAQGLAIDRQP